MVGCVGSRRESCEMAILVACIRAFFLVGAKTGNETTAPPASASDAGAFASPSRLSGAGGGGQMHTRAAESLPMARHQEAYVRPAIAACSSSMAESTGLMAAALLIPLPALIRLDRVLLTRR
jgi:hypothetical protein